MQNKTLEQWISDKYPDDDWGRAKTAKDLEFYAKGLVPIGNGYSLPVDGNCTECGCPTNQNNSICMVCGNVQHEAPEAGIALMEGTGRHMISKKRADAARDYNSKNPADLLQPYKYEKNGSAGGKFVKNPDFVKAWGDPEKRK